MPRNGGSASLAEAAEYAGPVRLPGACRAFHDGRLQSEQYAVEINRHDVRGFDCLHVLKIVEPSGRQIPPALSGRPNAAIHGRRPSPAALRGVAVSHERLVARADLVVPVSIEYRAAVHHHGAAFGPGTHPECSLIRSLRCGPKAAGAPPSLSSPTSAWKKGGWDRYRK